LSSDLLLRAEIEDLRGKLSLCRREKARLERRFGTLARRKEGLPRLVEKRGEIESRAMLTETHIRTNQEVLEEKRTTVRVLEEALTRCLRRRRAWRIWRLAYIAGLGMEKGRFTPGRMARDTGMKYWTLYKDIRLLEDLGILRRVRWGLYGVRPGVGREDLEDEIARSLAAPPDSRREEV
jgi:hypothetical protein